VTGSVVLLRDSLIHYEIDVHIKPLIANSGPEKSRKVGIFYSLENVHPVIFRFCLKFVFSCYLMMWNVVVVWRITGKIMRTVLCCIVYGSSAQPYTHLSEKFLQVNYDLLV